MSNKSLLRIENITKSYTRKKILNGITYDFKPDHMYAIVGESGEGKTTLLNIVGLLDKMYGGDIYLNGDKLNRKSDYAIIRAKNIGFIFQSYYLIDRYTVKENILLPLQYSKKKYDEEYFNNIVKTLKIDELIDENVNYLSGGEKQRVAIARALINKPQIIICDEPTGNLDESNAISVIEMLKSFLTPERTILLVTHSKKIASMCTDILYLIGGLLHEYNG